MAEDPQSGRPTNKPIRQARAVPARRGGAPRTRSDPRSAASRVTRGRRPSFPRAGDMNASPRSCEALAMLAEAGRCSPVGGRRHWSGGQLGGDQGHGSEDHGLLGQEPTPDSAQQRALVEAVSHGQLWLDRPRRFRGSAPCCAWSRAEWSRKRVRSAAVSNRAAHIAERMEGR